MPRQAAFAVCCALLTVLSVPLHAQQPAGSGWQRVLPGRAWFRAPIADPLVPRFGVGLLQTDLLSRRGPEREPFFLADSEDAERDLVAAVALGITIPFYDLALWPGGGLLLTGHSGVTSRFRIEETSRDDMGQDWVVGGGVEARRHAWAGRLRIQHRSSHLGDEFVQATGARRIEFGGEAVEAMTSYDVFEGARVYGGGGWIFHSMTAEETILAVLGRPDRWQAQAGGDLETFRWGNGHVGLRAGFDWQGAQRTNWRSAFAGAAGIAVRGAGTMGLTARFFAGPSAMGEFFLTSERYWAIELTGQF